MMRLKLFLSLCVIGDGTLVTILPSFERSFLGVWVPIAFCRASFAFDPGLAHDAAEGDGNLENQNYLKLNFNPGGSANPQISPSGILSHCI
jgi:hypothetical protein